MMKQINVAALCGELESKLMELHYSDDSMHRYSKVFREFTEYADGCDYSQSKGTDFLVWKFQQLGGFVTGGEHSKNEMYYFRAIRSLAEYYNFGILFRRHDYHGEIVWPEPFKGVTENFLRYEVEYGCSHWQFERCKAVIKDLILFLDSAGVHDLNGITPDLVSRFIATMVGLAPVTVAERISALRQYFKYAYLNEYTDKPIAAYLPHPPQRFRAKLPTVWTEEQIEGLINAVDTTTPLGKRDYAIILIGARLGFRIGDILNLTMNDIDWDNKQISIVQGKTRETLTLPLPADVGWAIIDYLKNGRPITEYPNIFVVHNAPYAGCPFKSTLRHNINKALKRAGIPIDKTKHYGWHSLRHSLATNLLQNNVETSTISDILGHSDPQVARHYLSVDMKGLSKCALEVEVMGSMSRDKTFIGPLAGHLRGLLDEKRSLGYKYDEQERLLAVLDEMSKHYNCSEGLPKGLCLAFVERQPNWRQATQEGRVALIRILAEYMIRHDIPAYMIDSTIVTNQHEDFKPYIFTHKQISGIFAAADKITPNSVNSHIFYPTILRVQYGCGLRISETLGLRIKDVDFVNQVLHVINAKNNKDRDLPVSDSVIEYMKWYNQKTHPAYVPEDYFFKSRRGSGHYEKTAVNHYFRDILFDCGIKHGGRNDGGSHLHNLRHTFCVHSLEAMLRNGIPHQAALPLLMTYMGHSSLSATGRYLKLTAEAFPDLVQKINQIYGEIIPDLEVKTEYEDDE